MPLADYVNAASIDQTFRRMELSYYVDMQQNR